MELTTEAMPVRSDLAALPFAVLLACARLLRATGILELRGQERIVLSNGQPVQVESDLGDRAFEAHLLKTRAIDDADIEPARALARSSGGKIGEALLSLGLIESNALFEASRSHLLAALVACFERTSGSVVWEPLERLGPDVLPIRIDEASVFLEGFCRFYDRRRLDHELPVADSARIYPVQTPGIEVASASIGPIDARLVLLAHGRPSLPSAALAVGLSEDDLRRHLYALYCLGLIGFELDMPLLQSPPARESKAARARTRAREAARPPATVSAPRTPPDREVPRSSVPPPRAPMMPERRSQLPPVATRYPVGATRPTKSVSAYVEDAELARARKDYEAALAALGHALLLGPDEASLYAEKAYTLMLCDPLRCAREANNLAREARRRAPGLPLPYVVLGLLMEQVHETDRAIQMYRMALQKDSSCEAAFTLLENIIARTRGSST